MVATSALPCNSTVALYAWYNQTGLGDAEISGLQAIDRFV